MTILGTIGRLGIKFGIIGGAVYYTTQAGLWGDSSQTEQLYKDLYKLAVPYIKQTPIEVPELPKVSDATRAMTHSWNRGVISSTEFTAHLPTHISNWTTSAYNKINELVSDPSPPAT